jgi:hypothetical protein
MSMEQGAARTQEEAEGVGEQWVLPQRYACYKPAVELLSATRGLLRELLVDYCVCLKCVLRLYSVDHPRLYNDPEFYLELLPGLLGEGVLKHYDVGQCCMRKFCWLCESVFQQSYAHRLVEETQELIA